MAQTVFGALRASAGRLGMTPAEYATRVLLGEKRCCRCQTWKHLRDFGRDRTRSDGRDATCRTCRESPTRSGPSKRERRERRDLGDAWCRDCEAWLAAEEVRAGRCRTHINEAMRLHYRRSADFRYRRKRKNILRARGVDSVPPEGAAYLLESFENACAYCDGPAETWDHIVPVSRGGQTVPWNIVPACKSCNSSKGNRDLDQWAARRGVDGERLVRVIETQILEHMPLSQEPLR